MSNMSSPKNSAGLTQRFPEDGTTLDTPLRTLLRTGAAEDLLDDAIPGLNDVDMHSLAQQALPEFGTPSSRHSLSHAKVNGTAPVTPTPTRGPRRLTPLRECDTDDEEYLRIAPLTFGPPGEHLSFSAVVEYPLTNSRFIG